MVCGRCYTSALNLCQVLTKGANISKAHGVINCTNFDDCCACFSSAADAAYTKKKNPLSFARRLLYTWFQRFAALLEERSEDQRIISLHSSGTNSQTLASQKLICRRQSGSSRLVGGFLMHLSQTVIPKMWAE